MHSDDIFGSRGAGGDLCDGNGAGVGSDDAMRWCDGFDFFDDFVFDVDVFEDGLDYDVGRFEGGVVKGGFQICQETVSLEAAIWKSICVNITRNVIANRQIFQFTALVSYALTYGMNFFLFTPLFNPPVICATPLFSPVAFVSFKMTL